MKAQKKHLIIVLILGVSILAIGSCNQQYSQSPAFTPTLIPTGLFVSPFPSGQDPMQVVADLGTQTALAKSAQNQRIIATQTAVAKITPNTTPGVGEVEIANTQTALVQEPPLYFPTQIYNTSPNPLQDLWDNHRNEILLIVATSIVTLIFSQLIPWIGQNVVSNIFLWIAKKISRQWEKRSFEIEYLNWIIEEHRYLQVRGIVDKEI